MEVGKEKFNPGITSPWKFLAVNKPKILMLADDGVRSTNAGALCHCQKEGEILYYLLMIRSSGDFAMEAIKCLSMLCFLVRKYNME
ncbi:MAG: hypothetical protein K9J25_06315 [Bacteroidales bacterium]|nr:hypothetical protein [Bacteroidales bacterium]